MCFSATSSFTGGAVIGSIGIATLRHVREPRSLLFAAVPLLFALHQFTEGMVWLGLEGHIDKLALDHMSFLFMLYAQAVLPLLMPCAVLLLEPAGPRRKAIAALALVGAFVFAWDFYGLVFHPSEALLEHGSIAYRNAWTGNFTISCLYIIATCGALLLSTHRVVRTYGLLNVVVLSIVQLVKAYAFASVWCFYAALMSVIIYLQFRQGSIDLATPNETSQNPRPFLLPWLRWGQRL